MPPVWFNHTNYNMKKPFFIITFFWTIACTIASGEVHAQPYKWIASLGATFQPILIGNLSSHGTFPVLASTHVRLAPTSLLTLPAPWTKPASWNAGLPADVEVYQFQGNIAGSAVKAFAVAVNLASPVVRLSPEGASATLRTPTQFYNDAPSTTPIVVNGGFFGSPNQSFSLLIKNKVVVFPNIKTVTRSFNGVNTAYYPTRGAFGVSACCKTPSIQWIYNVGASNTTYVYPQPSPNTTVAAPQPQPTALFPANANVWGADYAIGGSPVLIKNGTIQITDTEELISVNNTTRRARTAIGYMLNNVAVMLVVEEGTSQSVGVTLQQLATMMKDIGMFEALNLDGGGSTTLLINGVQAIQPSDGSQRAMSTVVTVKF
ncbi:MAG: phosphodiester glycosidase family protein [Runella slithyformis]|nr:MAG: phosphodiester glycosidase family protein [Runella slithyformis]TAF80941.1 MAG: phosphodiester glycosidase family protein [Runella slithyformis]